MPKVGLDTKTLRTIMRDANRHVSSAPSQCAFEPVVVHSTGVEAIYEALRLADIEGSKVPATITEGGPMGEDVDPRQGPELDP